jgi:hypothetical protein
VLDADRPVRSVLHDLIGGPRGGGTSGYRFGSVSDNAYPAGQFVAQDNTSFAQAP